MKKPLLALLILAGGSALALLAARSRGAVEPPPAASESFDDWAKGLEGRGIKVSAAIYDLQSGKLIEGWKETQALTPASTTKALTTYALMKTWKPNYTVPTEIWGDLDNGVVKGDLVFKGAGDPLLVDEQIWDIAEQLKKLGVTKVAGRVVADQSFFDGQLYGNGWQDTTKDTWPSLAALSVDFNRAGEGAPYTTDPTGFAQETLTRILSGDGIAVEGGTAKASAPRLLLTHDSPPLRMLVADINKFSNNFMIETLVKRYGDGSSARGVQKILDFYKVNFGFGPDQLSLTDACGLSKQNRIPARTLAAVLRTAWFDFESGPEYIASLKVQGGEPFKLRHKDANLAWRVRVKSGYLADARSLAGFIQMPDGRMRVFTIILNGDSKEDDIWDQISRWAN
jgi:D-alanyl-D-alanine carboxypeptidase/D-alanyl-D-alanine-endopeptidase (penicillin-binding protein 4)